jgi:DNA polymerase I-like protein with 3'-5' exonuclease and polymerase domains
MIQLPDLPPGSYVAVDTETSGLYVDDGARVATVQLAWFDGGLLPDQEQYRPPRADREDLTTTIEPPPFGPGLPIHEAIYAFDQGIDTPLGPKTNLPAAMQKSKKRRLQPSLLEEDQVPNHEPHEYLALMHWLADKNLIFHNAKFDVEMLEAGLRGRESKRVMLPRLVDQIYWDTQVMCLALWPWEPSSLKPTGERLWGEVEREPQRRLMEWVRKHDMRFDLAPWSLLAPYATKDAVLTLRLMLVQFVAMREQSLMDYATAVQVADREIALAKCLTKMESRGVGWDSVGALNEAQRLAGLGDQLAAAVIEVIRSNRPELAPRSAATLTDATMKRFWFDSEDDGGLGLFPVKMNDTGPSVDQEVVATLVKRGVPGAAEWQRLVKVDTARSMWYKGWSVLAGPPDPHWHHEIPTRSKPTRLRTSFNQGRTIRDGKGGTISGRLAVARWQAQAIPHTYQLPIDEFDPPLQAVNDLIRTDPGYVAVEIDMSQCEFRVAAAVSGCSTMIEAFREGLDVHDDTTERMFRIDKSASDWGFKRNVSKRLGLGMIYGAGIGTIARQIEKFTGERVAEEEIGVWVNEYRAVYPELGRKSRWAYRQAESKRLIQLAGGRYRWFGPGEEFSKAYNQLIQGGVAEMMKEAMVRVDEELPGTMLLQVHDSLVFEFPQLLAVDMCQRAQHMLVTVFEDEFNVPFRADAKVWATPDGNRDAFEWVVKEPF